MMFSYPRGGYGSPQIGVGVSCTRGVKSYVQRPIDYSLDLSPLF